MTIPVAGFSEKKLAEVKRRGEKPRGALGCDNCTPVASPLDMPSRFVGTFTVFYGFVCFYAVLAGSVRSCLVL
jgi:hypothetical protein